jgi:hypothetical protein
LLLMTSIILLLRVARIESTRRGVRQPVEHRVPKLAPASLVPPMLEGSLR